MGFRLSKSFKVAPGVRVRVSTKSVGMSVGGKVARVSANSRTGARASASLPGTGLSYSKRLSAPTSRRRPQTKATPRLKLASLKPPTAPTAQPRMALPALRQSNPQPVAQTVPQKPGLLAKKWERDLYSALQKGSIPDLERLRLSSANGARLSALFLGFGESDAEKASALLEPLWAATYFPEHEAFLTKYFPEARATVALTDELTADLEVTRDALGLYYAEQLQATHRLDDAIDVVEQLEPSTFAAVSLADLYAQAERWNDIIELTNGLKNEDDCSTYLLVQRGVALREQGFHSASREALKAALGARRRDPSLRHLALVERARTNLADGKRSAARKDLEKVLSEDAAYPGLHDALDSLDA